MPLTIWLTDFFTSVGMVVADGFAPVCSTMLADMGWSMNPGSSQDYVNKTKAWVVWNSNNCTNKWDQQFD